MASLCHRKTTSDDRETIDQDLGPGARATPMRVRILEALQGTEPRVRPNWRGSSARASAVVLLPRPTALLDVDCIEQVRHPSEARNGRALLHRPAALVSFGHQDWRRAAGLGGAGGVTQRSACATFIAKVGAAALRRRTTIRLARGHHTQTGCRSSSTRQGLARGRPRSSTAPCAS